MYAARTVTGSRDDFVGCADRHDGPGQGARHIACTTVSGRSLRRISPTLDLPPTFGKLPATPKGVVMFVGEPTFRSIWMKGSTFGGRNVQGAEELCAEHGAATARVARVARAVAAERMLERAIGCRT